MSSSIGSDNVPLWDLLDTNERAAKLAKFKDNLDEFDCRFLYDDDLIIGAYAFGCLKEIAVSIRNLGFMVTDVAQSLDIFFLVEGLWSSQKAVLGLYRSQTGMDEKPCQEILDLREMCGSALRHKDRVFQGNMSVWRAYLDLDQEVLDMDLCRRAGKEP